MPPVPVHIDDPITPQKAVPKDSPAAVLKTPTTTAQTSPYTAARPGAAAFPAPTTYIPSPQAQLQPTRTTPYSHDGPPPPQPGAVPVPMGYQAPPVTATPTSLPPPPKAGEAAKQYAPATTMPPQMSIPPPQQPYSPTHSTLPDAATRTQPPPPSNTGAPTTLNFGAVPQPQPAAAQHPPGYQQNVYAQEMSSAQRASLEQSPERRGSLGGTLPLGGMVGDGNNDTAGQVWNAVKGWANVAGTKLEEVHTEAWKRINSKEW